MIDKLKKLYSIIDSTIVGYELEEIEIIEKKLQLNLPKFFKKYLMEVGKAGFNFGTFFKLTFPNMYLENGYYVFYECCHFTFRWGIYEKNMKEGNPIVYEQEAFELNETAWNEKSRLRDSLFLMALINGTFYQMLTYTNYALVLKEDIENVIGIINKEWNFYSEINETKIYTKQFLGVILVGGNIETNGGYVISMGSNKEVFYKNCISKLKLNWEIETTINNA